MTKTVKMLSTNKVEERINSSFLVNNVDEIFFADVEKVPAKSIYPDFDFNSYNDTIIKVKTEDKNIIVNNCSSNYLLLPNKDIFPELENELAKFGKISIEREIHNYSSFSVNYDFLSPERKIKIANSDIIFPRISIENSYNSKNLFSVKGGFYRVVCTNGLCIPVEDSTFNTILSHCNGNLSRIISNTVEGINEFLVKSKEISEEYELLMEKKVSNIEIKDCVTKILEGTKSLISYKDQIIDRIRKENEENNIELNLFSIYNGINYMLQPKNNSKITSDFSSRYETDGKILDFIFDKMVG